LKRKHSLKRSKRLRGGSLNAGYYLYASDDELRKAKETFTTEESAGLRGLPKELQDEAVKARAAILFGPKLGNAASAVGTAAYATGKLAYNAANATGKLAYNAANAVVEPYNSYRYERTKKQTLKGVEAFQKSVCINSLENLRNQMKGITRTLTSSQQEIFDKLESYLKNNEYVCIKTASELMAELKAINNPFASTTPVAEEVNPFKEQQFASTTPVAEEVNPFKEQQ